MTKIKETDEFVVQRGANLFSQNAKELTAVIQDTDLMVVERSGTNYKVTGEDLRNSLGVPGIYPSINDITITPAPTAGSGTKDDPFILATVRNAPYGNTIQSVETLLWQGQPPNTEVIWTYNNPDPNVGERFNQVVSYTDNSGSYSNRLYFNDVPNSTSEQDYFAELQIGEVHFNWTVQQREVAQLPTEVLSTSLVDGNIGSERFTDQEFTFSTSISDGVPTAQKTIEAHVDGSIFTIAVTDKQEAYEQLPDGPLYSTDSDYSNPSGAYTHSLTTSALMTPPPVRDPANSVFFTSNPPIVIKNTLRILASTYKGYGTEFYVNGNLVSGGGVNANSPEWVNITNIPADDMNAVSSMSFCTVNANETASYIYAVEVDGKQLIDSSQNYNLTFPTNKGFSDLDVGDKITNTSNTTAVITNINDSSNVLEVTDTSFSPTNSLTWKGDSKVVENSRKYLKFDTSGNVSDLLGSPQDPPWTTTDSNPGLTFKFPNQFPSGLKPDEELMDGVVLTVGVASENSSSRSPSSGYTESSYQPQLPPGIKDMFATHQYTGKAASENHVNGIDLLNNGGLTWTKCKTKSFDNVLVDTERGVWNVLATNQANTEEEVSNSILQWNDNGYMSGAWEDVGDGGETFVSWTFSETTKFFDIVKYTGDGETSKVISHNLETEPGMVIIKQRTGVNGWYVYHKWLGVDKRLSLNTTNASKSSNDRIREINENTFTLAQSSEVNYNSSDYVAYLFANDEPDLIKCGGFVSNGGDQTINLGFTAQWVLIKRSGGAAQDWFIFDNTMNPQESLSPNLSQPKKFTSGNDRVTFAENQFIFNNANMGWSSGDEGVYVAIAAPLIESLTTEQYAEQAAKFLTYDNRTAVKEGEEALEVRDKLTEQMKVLGLTTAQIEDVLNGTNTTD